MWTIQLPLRIACDDRSKPVKHRPGWEQPYFSLNLNQYRNAHPMVLNNAKVNFEISARKLIRAACIPRLQRLTLEYVLYTGNAQLCDVLNVCSIVDKFFSDSLKHSKVIEDDNYKIIADVRYRFGAIDRGNPRVEAIIRDADRIPMVPSEPLPESETHTPMKITTSATHVINLTKEDLVAALRKHLTEIITIPDDANLGELKALADGTFELRIETGLPTAPVKPPKKARLDPKAAMAALHQQPQVQSAQEPAAVSVQEKPAETASETPEAPKTAALSAKELAMKEAAEMEAAEQGDSETEVSDTEPEEKEEPSQTEETDHSPKTELEKKLDTVRGTPDEAEVKAQVEKEREIKADPIKAMQSAKTLAELDAAFELSDKSKGAKGVYGSCKESLTAEKPKKSGGLFGNLQRPKN